MVVSVSFVNIGETLIGLRPPPTMKDELSIQQAELREIEKNANRETPLFPQN